MPTLKDNIFRELALRTGAISEPLLDQAADTQAEMERFGIPKFLGGILVEKKMVTREVVGEIVSDMEKYSVHCPDCQAVIPVTACDRKGNLKCRSCGEPVKYPAGRIAENHLNILKGAQRARQTRAVKPTKTDSPLSGAPPPPKVRERKKTVISDRGPLPTALPGSGEPRRDSRAAVTHEKVFLNEYTDLPSAPLELNRFSIQHLIGTSAAGSLYRILKSGEFGALKVLDEALCADKAHFKKWMEFMQRVQDLPRSATLKPTQFLREESINYIVRPYITEENATLRARLCSGSPMSIQAVTDLAIALLHSLSAFHSIKLVHGNLKPENVILSEGAVQLSDPGIHLFFGALTHEERIVRTWDSRRYQAPEVLQGNEPTTESDVFSVGHILEEVIESRGVEATSGDGEGGEAESAFQRRLRNVVARMGAFDPAERYASAREVLRDLQRKDRPVEAPPVETQPGLARGEASSPTLKTRSTSLARRVLQPQMVGPVVLSVVLAGLFFQSLTWFRVKSALASSDRDASVADKMVSRDLDALVHWTRTSGTEYAVAEERWQDMTVLLTGTSWESRAVHKSRQALTHVPQPERQRVRNALEHLRTEVGNAQWIPALEGILALEGELETEKLEDVAGLRRQIQEGLYEELGMVFIPGGEVNVTKGSGKYPVKVRSFLVDACLVSRGTQGSTPDPVDAAGSASKDPLVGIELENARRLASSVGKRLPTGAEWDLMAATREARGDWQEFAASRLRDVRGPVYQWVEENALDSHSHNHGVCRGGNRAGIPETHPLRRRLKLGHPDVGVRLVKDVKPGSLGDS